MQSRSGGSESNAATGKLCVKYTVKQKLVDTSGSISEEWVSIVRKNSRWEVKTPFGSGHSRSD